MNSPQVLVDYLSTGANRQTAVADWSQDGALAFGADSNIAIWSPSVSELNPQSSTKGWLI